jgi:hypothetical protein
MNENLEIRLKTNKELLERLLEKKINIEKQIQALEYRVKCQEVAYLSELRRDEKAQQEKKES